MPQINKPSSYFNTKLYTGNGSTQSIDGIGFQPDLIWGKNRSVTGSHNLCDAVRGATKIVYSNLTDAEATDSNSFTSFDSDGFSIGSQSNINGSGNNIVAWNWLAGGTASSNTDGSITSSVSANTTSGFSIVKWLNTASNPKTIGHGLGVAPKVLIVKNLNGDAWEVYHASLGNTQRLGLNQTNAASSTTNWNSTSPTSTVFTWNSGDPQNYITYCFAEKKGFSKFGSYTGNGNVDGTFIYTGFKPAFVILKCSSAISKWLIMDNKRPTSGGNPNNARLFADVSNAESTTSDMLDFCSNGFKLRTTDTDHNASGSTNIYMAFAESPLVGTNNIPATAR